MNNLQKQMASHIEGIDVKSLFPTKLELTLRDSRKLDRHIKQALMCVKVMGLGNTERLDRVLRSINKIRAFSPYALDGGAKLQQRMLDALWQVFMILETKGLDDAHFTDSKAPQPKHMPIMSDAETAKCYIFYKPSQRLSKERSKSRYTKAQQESLSRAYELFK